MKYLLFIVIAFAITKYSYSQVTQEWVQRYNGIEATSVSANSNVYTAGLTSIGLIIIKYNSSGVQQWMQSYSGIHHEYRTPALKTDSLENVYIIGNTLSGSVVLKYNSSGAQQWVNILPLNLLRAIEIDKSNNIYVTGSASDSIIEGKFVTIKFNSSGIKQWESYYYTTISHLEGGMAIAVDDLENVYVSGYSRHQGNTQIATVKYNSSGDEQWVRRYGSDSIETSVPQEIDIGNSQSIYVVQYNTNGGAIIKYNPSGIEQWVITDGGGASLLIDNYENLYVAGTGMDSIGNAVIALRKYDSLGVKQWAKNILGYESGIDSRIPMTIDYSGSVYLNYVLYDTININGDIVTVKYNTSGIQQWIQRFDGAAHKDDISNDIALDNFGNVYVTGSSVDTIVSNNFVTIKYSHIILNVNSVSNLNAESFILEQNYPNPFNPNTVIRYRLTDNRFITLKVYDILGNEIATLVNQKQNSGSYEVEFDARLYGQGSNLSSGIYFYKFTAGDLSQVKKMFLIK